MQQKTVAASTTAVAVIIAIAVGLVGGYLFGSGAFVEENQPPEVTVLGGHLDGNTYVVTLGIVDVDGSPDDVVIKWNKPFGTSVEVLETDVEGIVYHAAFSVTTLSTNEASKVRFTLIDGAGAETHFSLTFQGTEVLVTTQ